jgi:hypothetical protein
VIPIQNHHNTENISAVRKANQMTDTKTQTALSLIEDIGGQQGEADWGLVQNPAGHASPERMFVEHEVNPSKARDWMSLR